MPLPFLLEPDRPSPLENRFLLLLLVGISLAFGLILLPFYGAIMGGSIIALLFAPWYRCLLRWCKGHRTTAALLTLLAALLIVVLPLGLLITSVAREASQVYELIQSGVWKPSRYFQELYAALPEWVVVWLKRFGLVTSTPFSIGWTCCWHRAPVDCGECAQHRSEHAPPGGQPVHHRSVRLAHSCTNMNKADFLLRRGRFRLRLATKARAFLSTG